LAITIERGRIFRLDMSKQSILQTIREAEQSKQKQLILFSRYLDDLPPEIGRLEHLEHLDLSENHLTTLPPQIGKLKNLRSLNLESNKLSKLPVELCRLEHLQELKLIKNQITILPDEIGNLTELKKLDLSRNNLSSLPASFKFLNKLTLLDLSNNAFEDLPSVIGQLIKLKDLNLSDNHLSALPFSLENLTRLTHLDLSYNQFKNFPIVITQLFKLIGLDLSGNQIERLPADIQYLSDLQTFEIVDNLLAQLPSEIGQLSKLKILDVSENKLSTLPHSLTQLYGLHELLTDDNPLEVPYINLAKTGIYALTQYMSKGIDYATKPSIWHLQVEVPAILQPLLKQYLSYFTRYTQALSPSLIRLEVSSATDNLLQIELTCSDTMELDNARQLLHEFLQPLGDKRVNLEKSTLVSAFNTANVPDAAALKEWNAQYKWTLKSARMYGIPKPILTKTVKQMLNRILLELPITREAVMEFAPPRSANY
jgi:Leucine-rich repeat (LRR) protein